MIQLPEFVRNYLINNNYIGNTRTLIIGENYPSPSYATSYFYRSLPNCPDGEPIGNTPVFFKTLCNRLLIPTLTIDGEELSENERLNKFLESGFLLIDAQENLTAPLRPAILTTDQLNNLMDTIILINPLNIIFLTNNNLNVITALSMHPEFNLISNKILINQLNGTHIFAFPSAPANPNIFSHQIEHARQYYFI